MTNRSTNTSKAATAISHLDNRVVHLCRLLKIPSELRNRIYELVLIQPDPIRLPLGQSEKDKRALLRTCHQIHDEAVGIYYGNNAFVADCGAWFLNADLICWLRGLGWKKRFMLTDVRLSLRQQRVFSPLCGIEDTHFFIMVLIRRLDAMGLMLPEQVVRIEDGSKVSHEFLTISELEDRIRASEKKKISR
jgi:hypothetical protein